MEHFNGMKIKVSPHCKVQRMSVSREFIRLQSPELVAATNQWMLEFFGYEDRIFIIDPSAIGMLGESHIVMSPEHVAMLRFSAASQFVL